MLIGNVIDGWLRATAAGGVRVLIDPATGKMSNTAVESGPHDVEQACAAARRAFEGWRRVTPTERATLLNQAAQVLTEHTAELTDLEVADTGKPHALVRDEEIPASIEVLRFFAGACQVPAGSSEGEYIQGITSGIRREPIGVCGQIAPWNYPFMMGIWKWAPALAAGNTVVLKPSELTPSSTSRAAQLLTQVLPAGVLNVVCGGPDTGRLLARHPEVDLVSLTGSPGAGREVAHAAADRLIRAHLELGGNAPVVIFADADLAAVVEQISSAAFYNAGQDCTAATRVLVQESVHDEIAGALADVADALILGPPRDPRTQLGPLISAAHRDRVLALLATAAPYTKVLAGGRVVDGAGFYLRPTVVTGLRQQDELVQREIFGPVITVQSFADEAEAIELANGVSQGLTASVWTNHHARAMRLVRDLDFGAVSVNTHAPMASAMPHGGFGSSGYGKDLGMYGLEEYTRIKHVAHSLS